MASRVAPRAHPEEVPQPCQAACCHRPAWDVKADVLAIPIVGDPAFDGPLGEIDRRSGGELQALARFKEVQGKRYWTAVVAPGL